MLRALGPPAVVEDIRRSALDARHILPPAQFLDLHDGCFREEAFRLQSSITSFNVPLLRRHLAGLVSSLPLPTTPTLNKCLPDLTQSIPPGIHQHPLSCHEQRIPMDIVTLVHPGNDLGEEGFDLGVSARGIEFCDPDRAAGDESACVVDVRFEVGGVVGGVVPSGASVTSEWEWRGITG
jgi:hypothetical protein